VRGRGPLAFRCDECGELKVRAHASACKSGKDKTATYSVVYVPPQRTK